jgi:hypothetical protein
VGWGSSSGRGGRGPPPALNYSTRPGAPSFVQAARLTRGGPQAVEGIVRLAKAFPELPTSHLAEMQKHDGTSRPTKARPSSTVHGPSCRRILLTIDPLLVSLNNGDVLDTIRAVLRTHHSKLVMESVVSECDGLVAWSSNVADQNDLGLIKAALRTAAPLATSVGAALSTSTSYVKLIDVPYLVRDAPITHKDALDAVAKAGLQDLVNCKTPPRVVRDSRFSDTATVYFNLDDTVSGANAKALVGRTVQFGRWAASFRMARANPGSPLCIRCWKWGHLTSACRALQIVCPSCGGPHRKEHHRQLASCCKGNDKVSPAIPPMDPEEPCPHPPHCLNCRGKHSADDRRCKFWRHRFEQEWTISS